ncbi:MAG: hypothetical protein Q9182_003352, partial [Xanthomendoza sp. 2 TL-2023]
MEILFPSKDCFAVLLIALSDASETMRQACFANQRVIFTADPENIKAITSTQFHHYGKGQAFHDDWKDFLGDGVFTQDGRAWRNSRSLLRPLFAKTRISGLDIFEEHTQQLIGLIGGEGQEVNISDLSYKFTLDAATHFLLGRSVGSLTHADASFAQAFDDVQRIQTLKVRAGPFSWLIPKESFSKGLKTMDSFIEPFIQDTLRFSTRQLEENTVKPGQLTFLHALASFTKDRKVIRDQLVNVLLAGRDTTAGTLSFLFKELSANPDIYAKLRQEILLKIGPHEAPTYDDIKNSRYLQNVISETLRLYPSLPTNIRRSLTDTTLPRGGGEDGLSA